MSFHNALEALHDATPDKPPPDAKAMEKLYSSISQDTYGFYSEVIARIQEGRIGKHSWTAGNTQNDRGRVILTALNHQDQAGPERLRSREIIEAAVSTDLNELT